MMQQTPFIISPIFLAYGITCVVLSLTLLLLWIASGVIRSREKLAINPEDGARFGAAVSGIDPPAVARALRAHRNAEATVYPFLFLGFVDALAGGRLWVALPIFAIFTLSRIAHAIFYLRARQPWRTISFVVSLLAIFALVLAVLQALLTR
jgi:prostaglandin-E synthase 1